MVNLLPQKTIAGLRRSYYLRLLTMLIIVLTVAVAIGTVLLVPSYVVSERSADASERYLIAVEETIGVRERAGVTDDIRTLAEQLRILNEYANEPPAKPFFEDSLASLSSEIVVTGISFTKGDDALGISLAGRADSRAALLAFVEALQENGRFEGVTIPVTQLALDSNIPFSITATYRSAP